MTTSILELDTPGMTDTPCGRCGAPWGHVGACITVSLGRIIVNSELENYIPPEGSWRVSPSTWYDFYLRPARAGGLIGEGAYHLLVDLMCHADSGGKTFVGVEKLAERQVMSRHEAGKVVGSAEHGGFLARTGETEGRSHRRVLTLPAEVARMMPPGHLFDDLTLPVSVMMLTSDAAIFHRDGVDIPDGEDDYGDSFFPTH